MRAIWTGLGVLLASLAVARIDALSLLHPLWPAIVAFAVIAATRHAAGALAAGILGGTVLLGDGNPLAALRLALGEHLLPAIEGPWRIAALLFTLLLGAFAGVLERSGGFAALLARLLERARAARRRVLLSVYGLGLLCFFDGLANSMLIGRVARPAADRAGISREQLAWVTDSTSAPVACVAFISSWIAFQLSLIQDHLPMVDAYAIYFRSIPANPYCVLTLALVPFAIWRDWRPPLMRRFPATEPDPQLAEVPASAGWRVLLPIAALGAGIALSLQLWSGDGSLELFSPDAWRDAASGPGAPTALVAGSLAGLAAAWLCFPRPRRRETGAAALHGAAGLLPALVILILAWGLGSVFQSLGAAEALRELLGDNIRPAWLPLGVFGVATLTSFATGSSWGTMGLLMPLALGVLELGVDEAELRAIAPGVVGAVFGGAVFGDHCSPFSDTTVVSALAAGCRPLDHVLSQLPYALSAATAAALAYVLLALGLPAAAATACGGLLLAAAVVAATRRPRTAAGASAGGE